MHRNSKLSFLQNKPKHNTHALAIDSIYHSLQFLNYTNLWCSFLPRQTARIHTSVKSRGKLLISADNIFMAPPGGFFIEPILHHSRRFSNPSSGIEHQITRLGIFQHSRRQNSGGEWFSLASHSLSPRLTTTQFTTERQLLGSSFTRAI